MIAHRLSTLDDCDMRLAMENGRLIADEEQSHRLSPVDHV